MPPEYIAELKDVLFNLERKIRPLEWDAGRNQINEFKKVELERLKQEHVRLYHEIKELEEGLEKAKQLPKSE